MTHESEKDNNQRYYMQLKSDYTKKDLEEAGCKDVSLIPLTQNIHVATVSDSNVLKKCDKLCTEEGKPEEEIKIHISQFSH
jgi:hypothetical protein